MDETPGHWTVDRRIPLALVLTIIVQTVALVAIGSWYASDFNGRITTNSRDLQAARERLTAQMTAQRSRLELIERRQNDAVTAAARLEERIISQGRTLSRIERLLDDLYRSRERNPSGSGR